MSSNAIILNRRGWHMVDRLLVLASATSGAVYFFTTGLHPFPGSVFIKAMSILPLALLAFRLPGNTDGRILGASLLFSCLGDVFLGIDSRRLFLYGLGSFLIAHLLYIVLFTRS